MRGRHRRSLVEEDGLAHNVLRELAPARITGYHEAARVGCGWRGTHIFACVCVRAGVQVCRCACALMLGAGCGHEAVPTSTQVRVP
jgi:hypothetical protein